MLGFLQKLVVCAAAGTLLSLIFLTPVGGMVGAISGLLIGICVAMGEWTVQREEMVLAPTGTINLIGSHEL